MSFSRWIPATVMNTITKTVSGMSAHLSIDTTVMNTITKTVSGMSAHLSIDTTVMNTTQRQSAVWVLNYQLILPS